MNKSINLNAALDFAVTLGFLLDSVEVHITDFTIGSVPLNLTGKWTDDRIMDYLDKTADAINLSAGQSGDCKVLAMYR